MTGFRLAAVRFVALACALSFPAGEAVFGQIASGFRDAKLAEIDAAIEKGISQTNLPGGVFWLERQSRAYHKAFGRRAVVPAVEPMSEDTIFDVASLTKVLSTAPAIMLLEERGQLRIDEPVTRYLSEFRGEGTASITVRHLLTHTSGLRAGLGGAGPWEGYEGAIAMACVERSTNAPGTFFRYSDINYILLGEIVRRVSGRKLHDFVAAEFYAPLKMHDTRYLPDRTDSSRLAPTERTGDGLLRGTVHDPSARRMGGVAGHAGVFSTVSDVARFARMILNGGELDGVRVLQPDTVRRMTSVQSPESAPARRGLGWDIDSAYNRPRGKFPLGSFGHTGFTGCCLWIDPFSQTFFVFLSNRVHPDGQGNTLPLYGALGTLSAEAVEGFDFTNVPGSLSPRVTAGAQTPSSANFSPVLTGIDVLVKQNFAPLKKLRLGLITNHTGADRRRNATVDLLFRAPEVELKALFSPEHGIRGEVDAHVADGVDKATGLPVYSLYPSLPKQRPDQSDADYEAQSLQLRAPTTRQLAGLDALVFDVQDIGCRFYTYISTMGNCLEAAARAGLKFFVLDRPNPINGLAVEGSVHRGAPSFVAYHALPLRHGMTVGELAKMFNAERGWNAALTVIPMEGWSRVAWFDETGLGWVNPSPNMRSVTAATLYPGVGLLESAISVGRGTDRPFEQLGAPYVDDVEFAADLNRAGLDGVRFLPIRFTPKASTFANQLCGGVAITVTDRERCRPVEVGLELARVLHRRYPNDFAWRKMAHLLRDDATLQAIRAGTPRAEIVKKWSADLEEFSRRRAAFTIYK